MTTEKRTKTLFELIALALHNVYSEWRLNEVESLREHLPEHDTAPHRLEAALSQKFHELSTSTRSHLINDLVNHARRLRAEIGLSLPSQLVNDIAAATDATFPGQHGLATLAEPDLDGGMGRLTLRQAVVTALAIRRCHEEANSPFVRVAEDLGLSKANVSKILTSAERNLGIDIFERGSNGRRRLGKTTDAGGRLLGPLSRIADSLPNLIIALNPHIGCS